MAKVDELMVLCDDLETRQAHRHSIATNFRATTLNALTEARTTDDLLHAWDRASTNWSALTADREVSGAMSDTVLDLAVLGRLVEQRPSDGEADVEAARLAGRKHRSLWHASNPR